MGWGKLCFHILPLGVPVQCCGFVALGRKQNGFFSGERSKWARVARGAREGNRRREHGCRDIKGVFRNGSDWAERFDSIHP